ncbi:MAG: archaellin/type IV pilin N-terminal domain-containing protein [Dehalococcoidia bacterium]
MAGSTPTNARGQFGITGIETAIIMIAFVVVASMFAFTVLNTGVFSSERSRETVLGGLEQAQSAIRTKGSVIAFRGKIGSTPAVFKFSVIVENPQGASPLDLSPPYTADQSGTDPDAASSDNRLVVNYIDDNQTLMDVPWSVNIFGSESTLLEPGEKAEMTVWILNRDTTVAIDANDSVAYMTSGGLTSSGSLLGPNDRFSLQIQPPSSSVLVIERTLPPVLDAVMNLR